MTSHQRDADDALDDADVDAFLVQDRALFDVQFDERLEIARLADGEVDAVRVATDVTYPLADGHATVCHHVEPGVGHLADHCATAGQSALLVGETDDLDGMTGFDATFVQDLCDLDGADHANVAIVVAAAGDRVDM